MADTLAPSIDLPRRILNFHPADTSSIADQLALRIAQLSVIAREQTLLEARRNQAARLIPLLQERTWTQRLNRFALLRAEQLVQEVLDVALKAPVTPPDLG